VIVSAVVVRPHRSDERAPVLERSGQALPQVVDGAVGLAQPLLQLALVVGDRPGGRGADDQDG